MNTRGTRTSRLVPNADAMDFFTSCVREALAQMDPSLTLSEAKAEIGRYLLARKKAHSAHPLRSGKTRGAGARHA